MRKIFGMNVLRTSAFALACLALAGTGARAATIDSTAASTTDATTAISGSVKTTSQATSSKDPVVVPGVAHTYSTSGTVMTDGITGTNVISFNSVANGSFSAPSSVGLGEFVVSSLPTGSKTVYDNTHFTITYNPLTVDGIKPLPGATPVVVTGVLNGTIKGDQSSVEATFDPIKFPSFSVKDDKFLSTLKILNNPLDLVPASAGGRTTIQAHVVSTVPASSGDGNQTPEPTTLAILATSIVGFGLRQRLRSRRTA